MSAPKNCGRTSRPTISHTMFCTIWAFPRSAAHPAPAASSRASLRAPGAGGGNRIRARNAASTWWMASWCARKAGPMLNKEQQKLIDDLLTSLTHDQKVWIAGYLAGKTGTGGAAAAPEPALTASVALYYATETGNCKALSQQFAKVAKERGIKVKSTAFNKINPADLSSVTDPIIFITSTHGEGDPPEMAKHFIE